jgi:hypothetical protein
MPEHVKAASAESVRNIQGWKDALFDEPTPPRRSPRWMSRCC